VNFALFSENATGVELCLFDGAEGNEERALAITEQTNGVWHIYVPGRPSATDTESTGPTLLRAAIASTPPSCSWILTPAHSTGPRRWTMRCSAMRSAPPTPI